MNVNKKLDRFKQWAGERMGGEAKTNVSDDFKALEAEMNLRHDGQSLVWAREKEGANVPSRNGPLAQIHDRVRESDLEAKRGR